MGLVVSTILECPPTGMYRHTALGPVDCSVVELQERDQGGVESPADRGSLVVTALLLTLQGHLTAVTLAGHIGGYLCIFKKL